MSSASTDDLGRGTVAEPIDLAERLSRSARHCYDGSQHYRRQLDELGVVPEEIRSLEDLADLPILLDKEGEIALRARSLAQAGHPFGEHLCVPLEKVVSVSSTSGTTGDPTYYAFTASDIAITDELWARAFRFGGVRPGDTVLHGFGLSMFLAGVPVVRALERMGARPVPVGAEAGSEKLLKIARQVRPTAICCTPSYGEYLVAKEDLTELGIRHIFCAGEPGAGLPEVRARLSEGFGGATVTDVLGGVHGIINVSCSANAGMHMLAPDHSIQQLVDPDTGKGIESTDGAIGVRVKTTLDWRAQPQLRASVGDVYEVLTARCECGLDVPRARVIGRTDDMLIVKGVKIYPAAVQNLVFELRPQLTGHFRIMLDAPGPKVAPPLRMRVEVSGEGGQEPVAEFVRRMHSRFSVTPEVETVPEGTLPRTAHKAKLIEVAGQ
jgi:phenylacetate-CoA ligase